VDLSGHAGAWSALGSNGRETALREAGRCYQAARRRSVKRQRLRLLCRLSRGVAATLAAASLCAGCTGLGQHEQDCFGRLEALPATHPATLLAVDPRTSVSAADWGLHELAKLLPSVARGSLELHVLYTQDADDLTDGGGDGGPPQVLLKDAPTFPFFQVTGAPSPPASPTSLTAHLYCERLHTWQDHAAHVLQAEAAHRAAALQAWVTAVVARLTAIAAKPIPDTSGSESGVEADAGASTFTAAQVAEASPRPTILFLGGLTSLAPPSMHFSVPAHLVALVRLSAPARVLSAQVAWSHWITRAGGSLKLLSANDSISVIAQVLVNDQR
jgi:hypothetical protein